MAKKDQINLNLTLGLVTFANSLAGIFVSIFIFKNSSLQTTFMFQAINFACLLITYTLSGLILKKISSGKLLKLGIAFYAFQYLMLLVLRENALKYIFLLGIVSGIGSGSFWAGFNTAQYILTSKGKRIEYFSNQNMIINIAKIIAPSLGGGIISFGGYLLNPFLGYSLLFFTVFLVFSSSLSITKKIPGFSDFKFSFKSFMYQRTNKWKNALLQQFLLGCFDTSMLVVTGLLTYVVLQSEFWVGTITAFGQVLQTAGNYLSKKALNKNKRNILIGIIGIIAGVLFFAFKQTQLGVIVFTILTGFSTPFLTVWLSSFYLDTLDDQPGKYKEKYHFLIERDFVLGLPRMLSLVFLTYYVGFGNQVQLASYWLYVIPFFVLLLGSVSVAAQIQFSNKG